ncbi:11-beta-hydroxysteroid dehydrogenase B [Linum grandiflorum]
MVMNLVNSVMDLFVPPASMVVMAFSWPALCFINTFDWLYKSFYGENMEDKVVIVTGASSGIGEQIAYEYAKRGVNLVLVARRENRLRAISEKARLMGAKHVMIVAADVVKEDDCRRFVDQTVSYYGRVDHLVNTVSLGHTFYLEEAVDTSVFPHLMVIGQLAYIIMNDEISLTSSVMSNPECLSGHQFLGECVSDVCGSTASASDEWKNRRKRCSRDLVTSPKDELVCCEYICVHHMVRFVMNRCIPITRVIGRGFR